MTQLNRRNFLASAACAIAALPFFDEVARANPLGLPLGLQLYSVREQIKADFPAALAGVRAAGFTEVEAASLPPAMSAPDIRKALDAAGLRCVGSHHSLPNLQSRLTEIVDFDKTLGVGFIICPSPEFRHPASSNGLLTLDDWRYNAEQFNLLGDKLNAVGLRFGYHNHTREFRPTEGKIPYLELLRLTDPAKVTMELDCGWAKVAGINPVDLLRAHPHRFSTLHIKDFKLGAAPSYETRDAEVTELGRGSIDYRPIFAEAAKSQHIEHAFVEQEAFDMPWRESLKVDAAYLQQM